MMRLSILIMFFQIVSYGQKSGEVFDVKNVVLYHKVLCDVSEFGFVDLHCSLLAGPFDTWFASGKGDNGFKSVCSAIKKSDFKLVFLSLGVPRFSMEHRDTVLIGHLLEFMRSFKNFVHNNEKRLVFATDSDKANKIINEGKICVVYAVEGLNLIGKEPAWIDSLFEVGVRMIGIGHTFADEILMNPRVESLRPSLVNDTTEITDFGVRIINKLIEMGIIVDLSHLGNKAFWQAVEVIDGRQPLVVSHTASKSEYYHFRNLDDSKVIKISESNGMIGVIFHKPYLADYFEINDSVYKNHFQYLKSITKAHTVFVGSDKGGRIKSIFTKY